MTALLVRNLSQIATPAGTTGVRGAAMRELLVIDRAAIVVDDGRFAFETRNPLVREWERWIPANAAEVTDANGAVVRMIRQVEKPVDGNIVSFTHTFTSPSWDRPQTSRSTLRFLDKDSLSSFLSEAGLRIDEQFGDWDRQPLTDTSPEIITVAR